jgi:hypothetical protein
MSTNLPTTDLGFGPSFYHGRLVFAAMLQSLDSPGDCQDCHRPITGDFHYMVHKDRRAFHSLCHFKSPENELSLNTVPAPLVTLKHGFFK